MHSITAVMNLTTLHKTAPTRSLPHEHQCTKTGLVPGHNIPTPEGRDHNPPTMGTDMGDISTDHNHATSPTATRAASVTEGMHYTPHPATSVAHATLQLMDAPIATHAMTHPTGIVTPHLKLTTCPTRVTQATIPWTVAGLALATLTALYRDHS